ncbi:YceI family protein [Corynebacterium sp.]|uniref:YceI family protein n=1 Tax=Corynebacterium sp. TaxID=1720 RepID=UPI0027B8EA70|nr:YceI family protein [Corynebacterium sp.]
MKRRKSIIVIFVVLIVILAMLSVIPLLYRLVTGPGVKTEPLNDSGAKAASTPLDGQWHVMEGKNPNITSVGFTFSEILPGDERVTSGSTGYVTGEAEISDSTLNSAMIEVDMNELSTDRDVRDVNMKDKLFETSKFPTATFALTEPVDVSQLPEDGTAGLIDVTGELTIKDHTELVDAQFQALRDGEMLIVSGEVEINREDFGVHSPDLIAAKIAETGTVDIRLSFSKING